MRRSRRGKVQRMWRSTMSCSLSVAMPSVLKLLLYCTVHVEGTKRYN